MKIFPMLADALRSLLRRPVTESYPAKLPVLPERFRGTLTWEASRCTGCQLCVRDCPAEALELITIDKRAKQFDMIYYTDRCTFCGQCAQSCRFDCFTLSNDMGQMAAYQPADLRRYFRRRDDVDK